MSLRPIASCFPESAKVVVEGRGQVPIGSVRVGESVLALDESGRLVFSRVYYIPHDAKRPHLSDHVDEDGLGLGPRAANVFVRVHYEWSDRVRAAKVVVKALGCLRRCN